MNQKHICASAVLCSSQPICTSTVLWLGMVLKSSVHEHGICQNLFGRLGWLKGIHNASHSGTLSSGLLYTYRHTQVWNQQCSCNTIHVLSLYIQRNHCHLHVFLLLHVLLYDTMYVSAYVYSASSLDWPLVVITFLH